ncbi:hypothetical protein [Nonomuraea wenchangensis]|uniref:Uncharacterized protein n=1 Tax=Nonomuraea wenchangensis TaxID=568860 RepID=A0A1I0LR37_9ACTN|nr:hypothetical protein [Nonomuraea wenchangensis]SEU43880.1 hypothetical protein SAMN05421811_12278 [Nonomuraea wenchangensis]
MGWTQADDDVAEVMICPVRREAARKRTSSTLTLRCAADPPSWMNGFGKLCRSTEKNGRVVDFYLDLAAAFVTVRQLTTTPVRAIAGKPARQPM